MSRPKTLGKLKASGYECRSVKDEMRHNLLHMMDAGEELFPGIVGFDETVIPQIINSILSRHNFILLGLRGQAKTRILRNLVRFLDEYIPVVAGGELNDDPFAPISKGAVDLVREMGDDTPIEWLHRDGRYSEKLATPDVTIADLLGDIDPIKAATRKLTLADEEVIHFGIIPRSNRGIFAINELPDLQPRIQVGLLNILEEKDLQIRGFPVRIPVDMLLVFTANPEDYTNRGNIITPLKDRIASQIVTHYPQDLEHSLEITNQEAWSSRDGGRELVVPPFMRELLEEIAFQARQSEFVDQSSGVSARLSISAYENLLSNMERRSVITKESRIVARICDLHSTLPAITGKIELVFEGEREGQVAVARKLIGAAVKEVFSRYFPPIYRSRQQKEQGLSPYKQITDWFAGSGKIEISDVMPSKEYFKDLNKVEGLQKTVAEHLETKDKQVLAAGMEWVLEGLHQNAMLTKEVMSAGYSSYGDILRSMFEQMEVSDEI